jgi:hypothetical protein
MSEQNQNMPERIYSTTWVGEQSAGKWHSHNAFGGTEYIRADIHAALKERAESVTENPMRPMIEAAITGAMALGQQGGMRPDAGHWLEPWHERGAEFAAVVAELDEMRADRDSWQAQSDRFAGEVVAAAAERDEARAESARLLGLVEKAKNFVLEEEISRGDSFEPGDEDYDAYVGEAHRLRCELEDAIADEGDGCEICNPARAKDFALIDDYPPEDPMRHATHGFSIT